MAENRLSIDIAATNSASAPLTQIERDLQKVQQTARQSSTATRQAYSGVSQSLADLQAMAGTSSAALAALNPGKPLDSAAVAGKAATASFTGMTGAISAFGSALAGISITMLARELVQASIEVDRLRNSLTAATGSQGQAAAEMAFVNKTADQLGLSLATTAESYTKLYAAARGTALEGQNTRDIFTAVANASTALGLSADQTKGALTAIGQMISKGTVQAEELRGQLGERLPGAFQIAARSMGVTTAELGKMLEKGQVVAADFLPKFATELQKTFSASEQATHSAQAELNRFNNSVFEMKKAIVDNGGADAVISLARAFTGLTNTMTDNILTFKEYKLSAWDTFVKIGIMAKGGPLGMNWLTQGGRDEIKAELDAQEQLYQYKLQQVAEQRSGLVKAVQRPATPGPGDGTPTIKGPKAAATRTPKDFFSSSWEEAAAALQLENLKATKFEADLGASLGDGLTLSLGFNTDGALANFKAAQDVINQQFDGFTADLANRGKKNLAVTPTLDARYQLVQNDQTRQDLTQQTALLTMSLDERNRLIEQKQAELDTLVANQQPATLNGAVSLLFDPAPFTTAADARTALVRQKQQELDTLIAGQQPATLDGSVGLLFDPAPFAAAADSRTALIRQKQQELDTLIAGQQPATLNGSVGLLFDPAPFTTAADARTALVRQKQQELQALISGQQPATLDGSVGLLFDPAPFTSAAAARYNLVNAERQKFDTLTGSMKPATIDGNVSLTFDAAAFSAAVAGRDQTIAAQNNSLLTTLSLTNTAMGGALVPSVDLTTITADLEARNQLIAQKQQELATLQNANQPAINTAGYSLLGPGGPAALMQEQAPRSQMTPAEQALFDEAAFAAQRDRINQIGLEKGMEFAAMQAQQADTGYQMQLLQIQREADAWEQSWAMQTDSYLVYEQRKNQIDAWAAQQRVQAAQKEGQLKVTAALNTTNMLMNLTNAFSVFAHGKNKTLFELNKVAGIANATVSTYTGAANALDDLPYPFNIAAAASVIAYGLAQVAQISSTSFDGGGGGSMAAAGGAGLGTPSSPVVTQPVTTQPQTSGSVTVVIQGNVIGEDKWVEESLIPSLNAAISRNVTINYQGA